MCLFTINVIFTLFFTARSYGRIYIIAPFVSELDVLYFDILHKYKRQIQYSYITLR